MAWLISLVVILQQLLKSAATILRARLKSILLIRRYVALSNLFYFVL